MTTLLSCKRRRAAHGRHLCGICRELIPVGWVYLDQRCAEDGTAWTFRCHIDCDIRYWRAHRGLELWSDETLEWSEILQWEAAAEESPS